MSDANPPAALTGEDGLAVETGCSLDQAQSLEAVRLYLQSGSIAEVGRKLGVSAYELSKLTRTNWWMQELKLLRTIEQAQLDTSLTEILNMSLDELKLRLQFGEDYYDKEGNMRNRPLSAATLCRVADVVFDKRQLIRGLPTAVTNEGGKLQELAEKLEELGRAQSARTIEMDPSPLVETPAPSSPGTAPGQLSSPGTQRPSFSSRFTIEE